MAVADITSQATDDQAPDGPLLFGRVLDGAGGARPVSWADIQTPVDAGAQGVLWLHFDRTKPGLADWFASRFGMPEQTIELLLSNDTRPRAFLEEDHLVAVLRGLNFNPGADPEDMIALQIWAREDCVITLRRRRLQSPRDILAELDEGRGPQTAGDLVANLAEVLVAKMQLAVIDTNDRIDRIEDRDEDTPVEESLAQVTEIRRNCLALKRFMSPQHEALDDMLRTAPDWFSPNNRRDIRETVDRLRRYLEDLDVTKESAIVIQDDLDSRAAADSNKTMYLLSIVAAIFLPLSFLTGLLGINVGGMPGVDSGNAFWVTVILLGVILAVQLLIFRKLKWL